MAPDLLERIRALAAPISPSGGRALDRMRELPERQRPCPDVWQTPSVGRPAWRIGSSSASIRKRTAGIHPNEEGCSPPENGPMPSMASTLLGHHELPAVNEVDPTVHDP